MTVFEMRMNNSAASNLQQSPVDQASHAAAPQQHNSQTSAGHVLIIIAVIMIAIYGLKILGRVIKHAE